MQHPFVDVVIPHLNDHERLAQCLDLLRRQSYPAERFGVTVVDNGSDEPVTPALAVFPGARLLHEEQRGCGSARNRGVVETTGDIIAFTDSDCRPHPDWLLNGVLMLTTRKGVDIVGGEVEIFAADPADPTDAELFELVFGFECKRYVTRKHFAAGANIMVPRRVFLAVGPFRDGRLPEDLEWGRRASRQGFHIGYGADVIIRHPARHSFAELKKKAERTVWHARNHMAEGEYFRLKWAVYTLAMASPPLWKAVQIMRSPALHGPGQRLRALVATVRLRYFRALTMARHLLAPAPPKAAPLSSASRTESRG